jgi:hypothetical protein
MLPFRTMQDGIFTLKERPMTDWGDYGHVLQHGLGPFLPRHEGCLALLRTGPFIPPITFPGWPSFDNRGSGVVVTQAVRSAFEDSGLSGLSFQAALKVRIVWLPWHEWDLSAAEPHFRPPGGEPEGYILEESPSEKAAESLGDLWELVPQGIDWLERQIDHDPDGSRIVRFRILPERADDTDFFCVKPGTMLFCSARAKQWMESLYSECVSFDAIETL